MTIWKKFGAGLALTAGMTPALWAQIPAVPAPAVPGAPAVAVPAAPTSAHNIWSFLCMTPDQKLACKLKLCNSPIGQLLNNGMGPVNTFSGGLFGSFCPPVDPADLAKPATSAEGAAARIKASEADAKARRAAVRYLGTVDCKRWPEAQDALKNALRADPNECVRWEAAMALGSGCCCTPETIIALTLTVSGSKEDGNPEEKSERVKSAAYFSLQHCLSCVPVAPPKPPTPEPGPTPEPAPRPLPERTGAAAMPLNGEITQTSAATISYYQRVRKLSVGEAAFYARQALARTSYGEEGAPLPKQAGPGLLNLVAKAFTSGGSREMTMGASMEPELATGAAATTAVAQEPPSVPHETPVHTVSNPAPQLSAPAPAKMASRPAETVVLPQQTVVAPQQTAAAPQPTVAAPKQDEAPRKTLARIIQQRRADRSGTVVEARPLETAPTTTTAPTPAPKIQAQEPVRNVAAPVEPARITAPPVEAARKIATPTDSVRTVAPPVEPMRKLPTPVEPAPAVSTRESNLVDSALFALREMESPKQRASAAAFLGRMECRANPDVVPGLLSAAANDKDVTVRVEALRSLGKLQVNTALVRRTLEMLKADPEPRVRDEVMRTMNNLPGHSQNTVQPATLSAPLGSQ